MSNTLTSPNMGIVVPVNLTDPTPDWGARLQTALFTTIDGHNHTPGNGVQIPTAGLNINADLSFTSFNATALRSTRYTAQVSPLSVGTDVGCTYVSGQDLWYNDTTGRQIRLTNTGNANFSFLAYPERTPAISGNFTILATDAFSLYYVDTSGGAATVNLPASSGVAVGRTYIFVDIKRNFAVNALTIVPNGADKINTVAANLVINTSGTYTQLTTDAAGNWYSDESGGAPFDPLNIVTNLQWVTGQTSPTLTQAGSGPSNGTAQSIGITPQGANATNGTGGGVNVNLATPTGTGSEAVLQVLRGGVMQVQMGYTGGHGWLGFDGSVGGSGTNGQGNYLQGLGPQLTYTSNSGGHLWNVNGIGGSLMTLTGSWTLSGTLTAAQFFGPIGVGGGSNVITVANRATAPTSNPSGGGILYAESGASKWRGSGGAITTEAAAGAGTQNTQAGVLDASITFARTTTSGGTFTVDTPIPTNTSVSMRIRIVGRLVSGTGTVGDTGDTDKNCLAKNVSGTVTIIGSSNVSGFNDVNFNLTSAMSASSTNARLTVTAPTTEGATPTIDWTVWIVPLGN